MFRIFFSSIFVLAVFCASLVHADEIFRLSQTAQCCADDDTPNELVRFLLNTEDVENFRGTYRITASGTFHVSTNYTACVNFQMGSATLASFISSVSGDSIPWSMTINAEIRPLMGLHPELYVTGIIRVNNEESIYIYPLEVLSYSKYESGQFPVVLQGQITGGIPSSSNYIQVDNFLVTLD